jgi:hypothetical protein
VEEGAQFLVDRLRMVWYLLKTHILRLHLNVFGPDASCHARSPVSSLCVR